VPLIAIFLIAAVSLVIVRVGATALRMTGLSREVADFQALSCFFGVGFTTRESEMIVSHPVRRKIASHLIVIGNIGVITAFGALAVTFMNDERDWLDERLGGELGSVPFLVRLGVIFLGVAFIVLVYRIRLIRRLMEHAIQRTLERAGVVRALDLDTMLRARHGYVLSEYGIDPGHPLIGKNLGESRLGQRGVLVLGIQRESEAYVGAPDRWSVIQQGDVLTIYGREEQVAQELTPEATRAALEAEGGTVTL